ncbi:sigma-70 family RNA polymerase sigma factor [Gallaecimonas sp. GXIMD4217]|uniref:RNA polymerase sigma factor n=1 Tax=Gallaecimonas sp. GXIMD4217 TaxID=3131927 RepID=UPI00311ABB34
MTPGKESPQLSLRVLRAQAGCQQSFNALYQQFSGLTAGYLRQLGMVAADVDDLQQQLWLKAYRRLSSLGSVYAFKSWLLQIARGVAVDALRRAPHREESLEAEPGLLFEPAPPSRQLAPVKAALAGLPPAQREVTYLFYWQELSCLDIARIVGCSVGTVKTRLYHARQRLARLPSIQNLKETRHG